MANCTIFKVCNITLCTNIYMTSAYIISYLVKCFKMAHWKLQHNHFNFMTLIKPKCKRHTYVYMYNIEHPGLFMNKAIGE